MHASLADRLNGIPKELDEVYTLLFEMRAPAHVFLFPTKLLRIDLITIMTSRLELLDLPGEIREQISKVF